MNLEADQVLTVRDGPGDGASKAGVHQYTSRVVIDGLVTMLDDKDSEFRQLADLSAQGSDNVILVEVQVLELRQVIKGRRDVPREHVIVEF